MCGGDAVLCQITLTTCYINDTFMFGYKPLVIFCFLKAGIPCKLSPEAWIKDLAGTKPLSVLAKKVL